MAEQHSDQIRVPLGILVAAGVLIAITIITVAVFRMTGAEPLAQVPEPDATVDTRVLYFEDRPNGTVAVFESIGGGPNRLVHVIEPGEGGFIRGVLRSLARARRANDVSSEYPFHLSKQLDGRMFLEDPATGQRIYIQAFGPTNVESFQMILTSEEIQR